MFPVLSDRVRNCKEDAQEVQAMAQRPIRRSNRALSREDAFRVLREAEYGVLATVGPDGEPYGVPLNFCLSEDGGSLLFHSAAEGRKVEHLRRHPRVHFTAIGKAKPLVGALTTAYSSAMVEGTVTEVADRDARIAAVCRIAYRYGATFDVVPYAVKMLDRFVVFSLRIESLSGKRRPEPGGDELSREVAAKADASFVPDAGQGVTGA